MARGDPKKTISIRVLVKEHKAIEELLRDKPELGSSKTEFVHRLILEALKKHKPKR